MAELKPETISKSNKLNHLIFWVVFYLKSGLDLSVRPGESCFRFVNCQAHLKLSFYDEGK